MTPKTTKKSVIGLTTLVIGLSSMLSTGCGSQRFRFPLPHDPDAEEYVTSSQELVKKRYGIDKYPEFYNYTYTFDYNKDGTLNAEEAYSMNITIKRGLSDGYFGAQ